MTFQRPYSAHNSSHTVAEITGHNIGCVPHHHPLFFLSLSLLLKYLHPILLSVEFQITASYYTPEPSSSCHKLILILGVVLRK